MSYCGVCGAMKNPGPGPDWCTRCNTCTPDVNAHAAAIILEARAMRAERAAGRDVDVAPRRRPRSKLKHHRDESTGSDAARLVGRSFFRGMGSTLGRSFINILLKGRP